MIKIKRLFCVIIIVLAFAVFLSCEKKEPKMQPDPGEIINQIKKQFQIGEISEELSEETANKMYSGEKNKPVDLSKIEKYNIYIDDNKAEEIGIFKLYDKTNANYIKDMAQTRILKLQENNDSDVTLKEIFNAAEARSYGNYVYYVSHPQKDKIFEIIENTLRGYR